MAFQREVIQKIKTLVEEVEVLQKTVTDKKASRKRADIELDQLKRSVASSDVLTAKLMASGISSETMGTEVTSLKKEVT